jgi:hypothetical protein
MFCVLIISTVAYRILSFHLIGLSLRLRFSTNLFVCANNLGNVPSRNIASPSRNIRYSGNAIIRSICIVELRVTVNNIKISSLAQKLLLWPVFVAGNNKMYVGRHVKRPIFLSES